MLDKKNNRSFYRTFQNKFIKCTILAVCSTLLAGPLSAQYGATPVQEGTLRLKPFPLQQPITMDPIQDPGLGFLLYSPLYPKMEKPLIPVRNFQ